LSIRKRVLAFAAAGAAALVLGGLATSHHAAQVDAAGPTHAAIGCANSTDPTAIAFPATNGVLTTSVPTGTPALLSVTTPNSVVECGAVFEDDAAAAAATATPTPGPAGVPQDADPTTIDGGSITFSLNNGVTSGISTILEANSSVFSVGCGSTTVFEGCQGAVGNNVAPALPNTATQVTPNPANVVHVALRPGATFSLIGAGSPVVTISATYSRFATLNATAGALGPATATTNSATIGIATPTYASQLVPNPATISSTAGAQGSDLSMNLFHLATACTAVGGVVTLTPQVANGLVVCGGTVTTIQQFVPGAESGVVTFTTSSGVLGSTTLAQGGGQQILSVHCGALPATVPTILIPTLGINTTFALTSCQTAHATLFGGGNAGTAVVVANFVGDFTGGTTQATTQVQLAINSSANLTRGCNEVVTGPSVALAPVSGSVSALVNNLVSPSGNVVSVWMFNNSLHAFQAGYFNPAGPTDFSTIAPGQSIFICVSGNASFNTQ
jgi:hypothetical protein